MPHTYRPFGEVNTSVLFDIDYLFGSGNRPSLWTVMEAFCRYTEGFASRVAFGSTGALIMTTVPGDPNSGHFYLYDTITKTFYSLDFENQETFNTSWFDIVMTTYDLQEAIDITLPEEKKPVQYQKRSSRHHHRHNRDHSNNQQRQAGGNAIAA